MNRTDLLARIDQPNGPDGCWRWRGCHTDSIACCRWHGRCQPVHRVLRSLTQPHRATVWRWHRNRCGDRACVNPAHWTPIRPIDPERAAVIERAIAWQAEQHLTAQQLAGQLGISANYWAWLRTDREQPSHALCDRLERLMAAATVAEAAAS